MNMSKWSATRMLTVGFGGIIFVGALLLCLPFSSRDGNPLPFVDALFTSTSATCVTGLALFDTWTQFTSFGQVVILLLIQIGGLGFMTVAILFSLALGRRIGLLERSRLAEAVGATQIGGVVRLTRRILIGTALAELAGAILLSIRFIPLLGFGRGLWFSVFHSVSAFCNAGFDLMGVIAPSTSLAYFSADPLVLLTIAALIVLGGIGFVVWSDLLDARFRYAKLQFHSKVVLVSTAGLIILGALLFWILEADGLFAQMPLAQRMLAALFQSVTPRTAGFSALDCGKLTDASKGLTMFLMLVGASPGGTGGGMKTTTFLVICAAMAASVRNREEVTLGHFQIDAETRRRAFCSTAVYVSMATVGAFLLSAQGAGLTDAAFEALSALGTVGLSTGITPSVPLASKLILIILMYVGRLGSLTVFLAVARRQVGKLRSPVGKVIVS